MCKNCKKLNSKKNKIRTNAGIDPLIEKKSGNHKANNYFLVTFWKSLFVVIHFEFLLLFSIRIDKSGICFVISVKFVR